MKLYKLTDKYGETHEGYEFGVVGKIHQKEHKPNPELCSSDVFHAYENQNLAFLMNLGHANFRNPRLFEIDGDICVSDGLKVGSFQQEVIKELEIPAWVGSKNDKFIRVKFAILCAKEVAHIWNERYPEDSRINDCIKTVENWLENPSEKNRKACRAAAWADIDVASCAAGYAARTADAWAAANATRAAVAAADAADAAANAAANAADADATYTGTTINFCKLADEAVNSYI
jgi:hypothetical protein